MVFNLSKTDLVKEIDPVFNYYKKLYPVFTDYKEVEKIIKNKTTVFVGQTGVGKSTLLNKIDPKVVRETNEISKALGRGKHTTRNVTLYEVLGGKVLDTPGFSALDLPLEKDEFKNTFIEFLDYKCEYKDCSHTKEKDCEVKKAVEKGIILKSRYNNYLYLRKDKEK